MGRMRAGASAPLHPVTRVEHGRARAAVDSLLRADAARRDRGRGRDHRDSLDAPRRRLGSHLPARRLGRRLRDRRRAALPRRDELGRAARRVVGSVRDLEGRARRLGRDRPRSHRRGDRREALGRGRSEADGLRRAGASRRAGHRPLRQLVEPGALRQAHRSSVGPRDLAREPAHRARRGRDLPSDVPLRGALELRRGGRCCS